MARIGDATFLPKLMDLLQARDPFDFPLELDPTRVGLTIAIPADLLLSKAAAKTVQILGDSSAVAYFATQVTTTQGAVAAQYSRVRAAITPIVNPPSLKKLDLVGVRAFVSAGSIGHFWIDGAGPTGAAPTTPTTAIKSLVVKNTPAAARSTANCGLTTFNGASVNAEAEDTVALADRVVEKIYADPAAAIAPLFFHWPGHSGLDGGTMWPPGISLTYILPTNPHLGGWGIGAVAGLVNQALTIRWLILTRESY